MILKHSYILTDNGWNTIQNLFIGQKIYGIVNNKLILSTILNIKPNNKLKHVYIINHSPLSPETKLLTKNKKIKKVKNIKNTNILSLPKYDYSGYKLNPIIHKESMFDTCLILKLIGYFIKCGELKEKNITSFKNKKNKLKIIAETLNLLKIKNFISINNKGLLLNTYNKDLYDFLLQFRSGKDKHIPRKFLNFDKLYLNYLLNAMSELSFSKTSQVITTSSAKIVDNIHEISIKVNKFFNTTAIYRNPMTRKQYNPLNCSDMPYFETKIISSYGSSKVTKNKISSTSYKLSLSPEPKFIPIRNQSKLLWITYSKD